MTGPGPRAVGRLADYLADLPPEITRAASGCHPATGEALTGAAARAARVAATRTDPLLFALVYLPHHLTDPAAGTISLAEWHWQLREHLLTWVDADVGPKEDRRAYVAPRSSGKSTWLFLILPMWATAHRHRRFVAALADTGTQAGDHLRTWTLELDTNDLLRADYPDLAAPAKRAAGAAREVTNNRYNTLRADGSVFMARGLDSGVLGMKVGERRPDLIVLDDVEPGEAGYSAAQVVKRLKTLADVVLPLGEAARVVLAGTVTMPESIVHQLVKTVTAPTEPAAPWIAEERFDVVYAPALWWDDTDGEWVSVWPERWPAGWQLGAFCAACRGEHDGDPGDPSGVGEALRVWMEAHRSGEAHRPPLLVADGRPGQVARQSESRAYAKNMQNEPVGEGGDLWEREDLPPVVDPGGRGHTGLFIDPAVTDKATSDYYGLSVVARPPDNRKGRVEVWHAEQRRMSPEVFRQHVLRMLARYPDIGVIYVESNQGGDLWMQILRDVPCRVLVRHHSEGKLVRATRALTYYQSGAVGHAREVPAFTSQAMVFPNGLHDDVVDAVSNGILFFLDADRKAGRLTRQARTSSYV